MGRRALTWVLLFILVLQESAEGKLVRKKSRSANKPLKSRRGTEKYGERLPWESRQETYDWEFREVCLHPKSNAREYVYVSNTQAALRSALQVNYETQAMLAEVGLQSRYQASD